MPSHTVKSGVVSNSATGYNNVRKLARSSDGALHCVWEDKRGDYYQIYYAKSTDGGETWTETAITSESYNQYSPSIAIDSNNYIHITWAGSYSGTSYSQIRHIKYTTSWGNIENLTNENYSQYDPSIAIDNNNCIHITWCGAYSGVSTTQIRYIKYDGSAWGNIVNLTSDGNYSQLYPSIAIDSNNYIHITWYGKHSGSTSYNQIRYIKYTTSWGDVVNLTDESYNQFVSSIAIDSNNCIYIVWFGAHSGSTSRDQIRYRKYTTSWSDIENLTSGDYDQSYPSIAIDSNNYIHITWYGTYSGSTSKTQIRYRKYTTSWGNIENLTSAGDHQQYPSLIWANYPVVSTCKTNRPKTGYAFVWTDCTDTNSVMFYKSSDLAWDTGTILEEYFNSYADGDLNGKGSWTGDASFDIGTTGAKEGRKGVQNADTAGSDKDIAKTGTQRNDGRIAIYLKRTNTDKGQTLLVLNEGNNERVVAGLYSDGHIKYKNSSGNFVNLGTDTTYSANTWYLLEVEWRSSDHKIKIFVDGVQKQDWVAPASAWTSYLDKVILRVNQTEGTSYWDYISEFGTSVDTSNWSYIKKCTIDHTKIDEDLTNFPVLVKIDSSKSNYQHFFDNAGTDGASVRFVSSTGSSQALLKFEKVRFDATNKKAEYFVKIPSVSKDNDTVFRLLYGRSGSLDGSDKTEVWGDEVKAMWHMKDDPDTSHIKDSTINANNGTKKAANEPIEADGKVGKAQSFDGTNDSIDCGDNDSLKIGGPFTIEFLFKRNSGTKDDIKFLGNYNYVNHKGFVVQSYNGKLSIVFGDGETGIYCAFGTDYRDGEWHHFTITKDENYIRASIDGVEQNPVEESKQIVSSDLGFGIGIGSNVWENLYLDGLIDEIKISNTACSAAWRKTSYNSLFDNLVKEVNEVAINKSLKYCVKTIPTKKTKSLKYDIFLGSAKVEKSLHYAIAKATKITKGLVYKAKPEIKIHKSLRYCAIPAVAVQKSLKYTIKTTPIAKTKQLKYAVLTIPAKTEKELTYEVLTSITQQKSLKYTVITEIKIEKNIAYSISLSQAIEKTLKYTILTTPEAKTKQLKYCIFLGTTKIEESLCYKVKSPIKITKGLIYAIKTPIAIQRTLKYIVETTPAAITKPLRYDIFLGSTKLEKGLTYDVLTSSKIEKSLHYEVLSALAIQKGLIYKVVVEYYIPLSLKYTTQTIAKIEKTLKYVVETTPTAITKALRYNILSATNIPKLLQYAIRKTIKATKGLIYKVLPSIAIDKTLKYCVLTTPVAEQKELKYCVLTTPAEITKGLIYDIITETKIEKNIAYSISLSQAIEKTLKYTILTTPEAKTKQLKYCIFLGTTKIEESLCYKVKSPIKITKGLIYAIKTPIAIQRTLKYIVETTPAAITKPLRYDIFLGSTKLEKGLTYDVLTSSKIEKSLHYEVLSALAIQKGLIYKVVVEYYIPLSLKYTTQTIAKIEKTLKYVVETTPTAITKALRYNILSATNIPKLLQYAIRKTIKATKGLIYKVLPSIAIDKTLKYCVLTTPVAEQKELKYCVLTTPVAEQKELKYCVLTTPAEITKGLIYDIITETKIEKDLCYKVIIEQAIQKSLAYEVMVDIAITKELKYYIINKQKITKELTYEIKKCPYVPFDNNPYVPFPR